MNAPDRYERFVLPDDVKKVAREIDTKVRHAATFVVEREDHTIGNLVRMQLHRDSDVLFAGYKVPHPLEYKLLIKVQTKGGHREPPKVLTDVLTSLEAEVEDISEQFKAAASQAKDARAPSVPLPY